ncbi:hypothetical protein B0I35DRAFT_203557 [Stachybotrys elegans]|uniref:Uncharacterized protein n=1 Tax=Stachybotrys elegans TaxID=80388 RepID=A0A8K0WTA2_9HYPO|nr:hypothetical protein B0I35DRAFT_203557 [Stachybotrys elegans]
MPRPYAFTMGRFNRPGSRFIHFLPFALHRVPHRVTSSRHRTLPSHPSRPRGCGSLPLPHPRVYDPFPIHPSLHPSAPVSLTKHSHASTFPLLPVALSVLCRATLIPSASPPQNTTVCN